MNALGGHFPLETGTIYLNHGTVGVTPLVVMRQRAALLEEVERHPSRFMIRELVRPGTLVSAADGQARPMPARLRHAADRIAAFLGGEPDSLVFVDNASSGVNAVLRSLHWQAGDEILIHDQAYGGVVLAAEFIAREQGVAMTRFALPFPLRDPQACVAALEQAITAKTRLVLLDHVSSETALVFPLAEMAAVCHAKGVPVLADGAHAPGAIDVDLATLGVDWYAANLHKWAFAPRACGVLWAAPERRAGLHPAVLSWGLAGSDWLQEFDWTGTRDPTPWLAAPAGLDFMHEVLGLEAMRAHNHRLAWWSAGYLSERWGGQPAAPEGMIGCMATVALPPGLGDADMDNAQHIRDTLLVDHGIEIPVIARNGALWARVSIQVYNEEADIEALAAAIESLR